MQGHFTVQGNTATESFYSGNIFRSYRFSVFYTPSQTVQGRFLIYDFQSVQEWRDIFVVTNMQTEGDSSLYQFGNILFNVKAHRILVNDYGRFIEVFMIVQYQPEHFAGAFIFVTMRHRWINIFSRAYRGSFCYCVDLCIYQGGSADIAKLNIDKRESYIQAVFLCQKIYGGMALCIAAGSRCVKSCSDTKSIQFVDYVCD